MRISNFEVRSSNSQKSPIAGFIRNSKFELRTSAIVALATIALLLACAPSRITREKWLQMSQTDKTIYVSSLIGGEKAKQNKGGSGRSYGAPPEQYAARIDAAYARGDQRDAATIFAEMADHQ